MLRLRLRDLAGARVRYGYRRLHILLQREGWHVNHKRVFRLYHQEGRALRLKSRKKRVSLPRVPPPAAERPNQRWSMDFMADRLTDERVVVVLDRLKLTCGLPEVISVDNGPEIISRALDAWAHHNGVKLEFSRPGRPTDNPFIESFNGHFREECLDQHWFADLAEARQVIEAFRVEYNRERPHSALGNRTPAEFLDAWGPPTKAGD